LALRRSGWTLASIGNALGVSTTRALQLVRKAERLSRNPHWYDALPARARTFLHNMDPRSTQRMRSRSSRTVS